MCGNTILIEVVQDPEIMAFRFTHELGHLFGLPHMEDSYMFRDSKDRTSTTDRFLPCQQEILSRWEQPGTMYVAHWREQACASSPPWWDAYVFW